MKILYGYTNCTDKKYSEIFAGKTVSALLADQKYHSLLIDGLAKNGAEVLCVSGLPINRAVTKKLFIREKDEEENGVKYHYINTINLPLFRQFGIYFGTYNHILKNCKKGENDTFIICDCLNLANAYGALKAAKKRKIPLIYVVTDIPEFQRGKVLRRINDKLIAGADGFIFLTEQMNEKVNPYKKPYIVLEGHADCSLTDISDVERYEYKDGKKIVIYAGSIKKLYGIQNLVEGFIAANIDGAELHVYGDGDYKAELESVCKENPSLKYMGISPNCEIVHEEQHAALLVNPRPTAPEYTKYSFPSKNMEYMASGTPVMTTLLPGMPKEYYPYVYKIEDETPNGVAKTLNEFFSLDKTIRYDVGKRAREFVLNNKSNVVQAKKIIDFIKEAITATTC